MNEGSKLNGLSYKELQALALKYKVPGNIRKHVLIKILRAVKEGNDLEVQRILHELHQNRKKRRKKSSRTEKMMNVGPLLNYDPEFHGDIHYCRNTPQTQYQWIAGEEEVRESDFVDNRGQIPSYEEFHQFLSGGIQQQYFHQRNVIGNTNERSQSPAIVDLRINPDRGDKWDDAIGLYEKSQTADVINHQVSTLDYKPYRSIETIDDMQQESSRLLKKMLQAPAGTNLKQLANYDTLYHIQSMNNNNIVDDSDTLTADSESNINLNQIDGRNEWVENPVTNVIQDTGSNYIQHYRFCHNPSSDIIENCQKWLANSSYVDNINNATVTALDNSHHDCGENVNLKIYNNPMCYYHTDDQYWSLNIDQKCSNEYQYQDEDQCDIHNGALSGDNKNITAANTENDVHEWTAGRSPTGSFALSRVQSAFQNRELLETLYNGNAAGCAELQQHENRNVTIAEPQNSDGHRDTQYRKYNSEIGEYFEENYTPQSKELGQLCGANLPSDELPIIKHSIPSYGYWPQWTASQGDTSLETPQGNLQLENLLNLKAISCRDDQGKSDQTVCVYCYAGPVVTHRIFTTSSPCSQKIFSSSEFRQPSLTTNCLLYDNSQPLLNYTSLLPELMEDGKNSTSLVAENCTAASTYVPNENYVSANSIGTQECVNIINGIHFYNISKT